jgi:PTH1 family peptidyl-tRNA hydrolase
MTKVNKVLVCLGNPGSDYDNTRHNAGFDVARALAKDAEVKPVGSDAIRFEFDASLNAQVCLVRLGGQVVALVMPQTFMNDSGKSARAALKKFNVRSEDMLVIHDDTSLDMGRLKFQSKGSAGGQHGVESVIKELAGWKENDPRSMKELGNTFVFDRLKFAVGPDPGGAERYKLVLRKYSETELALHRKVVEKAVELVKFWASRGIDRAMSTYNNTDVRT